MEGIEMDWEFIPAREGLIRYRDEWDRLNYSAGNHILLDSGFVEALVRHFAPPDALLAFCRSEGAEAAAVLHRVQVGLWETVAPAQSPLGLIVASNGTTLQSQMRSLMTGLPGYAVGLSVLQQDLDHSAFRSMSAGAAIERLEYQTTGRVSLKGSFEEYWRARGKDLVGNQSRRRRRLAGEGHTLTLVVDESPDRVADCIAEYGNLEETGWKGQEGTAVSMSNTQGLFYKEVLEYFCHKREGVIYRLLMDGKTIASQLCVRRGRMLVFLKMAYDEAHAKHSPGYLLREEILRSIFSEGTIKSVEFYGKVREGWTTKWTDELRAMYHFNMYRHSWVSGAKALVKRLRAAHTDSVA
jgi:CelD/BcsL family acetyltransferase involved in cellulose biosynthesis